VRLNPKKTATTGGSVPPQGEAGDPVAPDDSPSQSQPLVLHRQQALNQHSAAGDVIDLTKRQHKQKGKKEDEVSRRDDLSPEARTVLRGLARTFIESCFNRAHLISFPILTRPVPPYLFPPAT
jgi:replication fork protection complex subunit Tof1/Swi1